MPATVKLREDFSAEQLRALAKRSKNAHQSRRLLSLAAVRDGMDRGEAAKIGGMDRQTLRDWVHRFNAKGPDGLIDNWTSGPTPRLSADQLAELTTIVETGLRPRQARPCGGLELHRGALRRGLFRWAGPPGIPEDELHDAVLQIVSRKTAVITYLNPFSPSMTAIRMSLTSRFLSSFVTRSSVRTSSILFGTKLTQFTEMSSRAGENSGKYPD
jgi:transposase